MDFLSSLGDALDNFVLAVGENVIEQLGLDKMSDQQLADAFDSLENYFNTYDADDDEYQENIQAKMLLEIFLRARGYSSETTWYYMD